MPPRRSTRSSTRSAAVASSSKTLLDDNVDIDYDPAFAALPHSLQAKIDAAFDRASRSHDDDAPVPRKRRKLAKNDSERTIMPQDRMEEQPGGFVVEDMGGGFIVDDSAGGFLPSDSGGGFMLDDAPGGFIPDAASDSGEGGFIRTSSNPSDGTLSEASIVSEIRPHIIPLSAVPGALVRLGLPPDDLDVRSIFEKAATGWSGNDDGQGVDGEKGVRRKDWRAVCSILLDGSPADEDDHDHDHGMKDAEEEKEENDLSDPYMDSDEDAVMDVDASDNEGQPSYDNDEYGGPRSRRKRNKAKKTSRMDSDEDEDDDEEEEPLDRHQLAELHRAFGLFLDASGTDKTGKRPLETRRLGVRELAAAADLLKEKLTAEDIIEMLEMFSTTPDKTMGMAEFERMMRTTRLV